MEAVCGGPRQSFSLPSLKGFRDELVQGVCRNRVDTGQPGGGGGVEHLSNRLRAQGRYEGGRTNGVQLIYIEQGRMSGATRECLKGSLQGRERDLFAERLLASTILCRVCWVFLTWN